MSKYHKEARNARCSRTDAFYFRLDCRRSASSFREQLLPPESYWMRPRISFTLLRGPSDHYRISAGPFRVEDSVKCQRFNVVHNTPDPTGDFIGTGGPVPQLQPPHHHPTFRERTPARLLVPVRDRK